MSFKIDEEEIPLLCNVSYEQFLSRNVFKVCLPTSLEIVIKYGFTNKHLIEFHCVTISKNTPLKTINTTGVPYFTERF